jgi:hypothetical protein
MKVKWEDIKEIKVRPKITFESTTGYKTKYNWIHICLAKNLTISEQFGEKNATKKVGLLYYIIYKPEKAKILAEFCTKYRPDLDLTDLLKEYSTKPKTKWGYWRGGIDITRSRKSIVTAKNERIESVLTEYESNKTGVEQIDKRNGSIDK